MASVRRSPAINGAKGRRAVVEHCKHRARAEGASYQEAECKLSADDKSFRRSFSQDRPYFAGLMLLSRSFIFLARAMNSERFGRSNSPASAAARSDALAASFHIPAFA